MNLPRFSRLYLFERLRFLYSQKKIIGLSAGVSFCMVLIATPAIKIRNTFVAGSKTADTVVSNDTSTSPTPDVYLPNLSESELNILGAFDSTIHFIN